MTDRPILVPVSNRSSTAETLVAEQRIAELCAFVGALERGDSSARVAGGDGSGPLDTLAVALNELARSLAEKLHAEAEDRESAARAQRLASVGLLAAGVAHEVNNPASSVLTNLEGLDVLLTSLQQASPRVGGPASGARFVEELAEGLEEARATVGDCVADVGRIVSIVRDLRSFSQLDPARVEVLAIAELAGTSSQLAAHQVRYRARLVQRLQKVPAVRGDRTRLGQVITNLVLAAARAIPEGAPAMNEVEVSTLVESGRVVVRVWGTGESRLPRRQTQLFAGVQSARELEAGAGLELAISAEIARKHGGDLRVEQHRDGSTLAVLSLPIAGVPAVEASPELATVAPRRAKVLFVDDEPPMLAAYRRTFGKDYDVTLAGGGREALAILEADGDWDTVLCDIMMPDIDGVAVYEWIRRERPRLLAHVAFCSAGTFTGRSSGFAEMLHDRLLEKPTSRQHIVALIERLRPSR